MVFPLDRYMFLCPKPFSPFCLPDHSHFQKSLKDVAAVQIGRGAILTNHLHLTSKLVCGGFITVPPVRLHAVFHHLKRTVLVLCQPTHITVACRCTIPVLSSALLHVPAVHISHNKEGIRSKKHKKTSPNKQRCKFL